ncbi:MAG: hypothetical protein ABIL06_01295 [Pseudomonadota bacterium]
MHKTIEALYKDGKIIPLADAIPAKEARVLITFLESGKRGKAVTKKKGLKLTTYRCGGKIRGFSREDAYDSRI